MAIAARVLILWAFVTINISKTASGVKESKPKHHSTSAHPLKKTKSGNQIPEQKSSIRNPGMAFDEMSKELIKSRLDKSLGVLGPWKQNAGDLYMGSMGLKGHEGLLNQPVRPAMRINGYPINPKGSMSLTQMIDGTLDNDLDLQQIVGQMRFPSRNWKGQWFRGMGYQAIGLGSSRGMPQGIMRRMIIGNMFDGHKLKRKAMHQNRKLRNKSSNGQVRNLPSRGTKLNIHHQTSSHHDKGNMKQNIFMTKRNKK